VLHEVENNVVWNVDEAIDGVVENFLFIHVKAKVKRQKAKNRRPLKHFFFFQFTSNTMKKGSPWGVHHIFDFCLYTFYFTALASILALKSRRSSKPPRRCNLCLSFCVFSLFIVKIR
jgi:hypothetical protein